MISIPAYVKEKWLWIGTGDVVYNNWQRADNFLPQCLVVTSWTESQSFSGRDRNLWYSVVVNALWEIYICCSIVPYMLQETGSSPLCIEEAYVYADGAVVLRSNPQLRQLTSIALREAGIFLR